MTVRVLTKADLISQDRLDGLDKQAFGGTCSGCGTRLETEGDFARHFLIRDATYLNLGECPHTPKGEALAEVGTANIPYYKQGGPV